MSFIDVRTVVLINMLTYMLCAFVIFLMWKSNRTRFKGITYWLIDVSFIFSAHILLLLRGHIPDFFSIIMSNLLAVIGTLLCLYGLELFTGNHRTWKPNIALIGVFTAVHLYATYWNPSLEIRNVNISAALFLACFQCMVLMLWRVEKQDRHLTRFVGLVFAAFCLANFTRVVLLIVRAETINDLFAMRGSDAFFLIVYQLLLILLTYSLLLMVSNYLRKDLVLEEEKFSKAFHSSPYALILSDLENGIIVTVNEGFVTITGYAVQDAVGRTSSELHLWTLPEERNRVIKELSETGHIQEKEISFRTKSGEIRNTLFSADSIAVGNKRVMLSSISDITERKKDEDKIRTLLKEKELLLKDIHHRVKNNMNMLSSLLYLQAEDQNDENTAEALHSAVGRVNSMMVLYDKLYLTHNSGTLSLRSYFPPLIDHIISLSPLKLPITHMMDFDDIVIDAALLSPLGLVFNELITNSIKYAFPGGKQGVIAISAKKAGSQISIVYQDNGVGLPDNFSADHPAGFGTNIISMMVSQIHGSISYQSRRDEGMSCVIEFDL